MKRYTVLYTIETGGPGGAETVLLELASRINPIGFRPVALLPEGTWLPGQLKERNIPFTIASSRAWHDPTLLWSLAEIVRKEKVDLIHSHLSGQNFYSCLVGRYTGRPTIVTYHGGIELPGKNSFRDKIKSWVVRKSAAATVVVSDYLKRAFEAAGFAPEKTFRIYNGVDFSRFDQCQGGNIRAKLGMSAEIKLVGMVANLRPPKGYMHFVSAARLIADRFPEARFLAVGEGDNVLASQLKEQIHRLNLDDKFLLLGFRSDVPEILKDLDVFVLSSIDEGLSIATIEAMGAGKPVVVTRSGGPEEIVEEGKTGFLVPPGDPTALATRVCEILSAQELGSRLGEAAKIDVRKRFSVSQMLSEYETLYLRCLNAD